MKCRNNCDNKNLEWFDEGEVFPYEIWKCKECNKMFNIELVRDFKNKEER